MTNCRTEERERPEGRDTERCPRGWWHDCWKRIRQKKDGEENIQAREKKENSHTKKGGTGKNRGSGKGGSEGRRKVWSPDRVPGQGVCHTCAPTNPGGMCWVGRNALLTHTYMHKLHQLSLSQSYQIDRTTQATAPFKETLYFDHSVKCFSGFIDC